jgi:hypothetical protein
MDEKSEAGHISVMAQSPPKILLIAREPLKPGSEAEYDRTESETATLAAKPRVEE